jgi:hypothetical protein
MLLLAIACLLAVAVTGGVARAVKYEESTRLVVREFMGEYPELGDFFLSVWRQSGLRTDMTDDFVKAEIDRARAAIGGAKSGVSTGRVYMQVADGKINYLRVPDGNEVVNSEPIPLERAGRQDKALFATTSAVESLSPEEALRRLEPARRQACEAALAFWNQRTDNYRRRLLDEQMQAVQLSVLEPHELVHTLAQYLDLSEDVVWRNVEAAVRLAKLIRLRELGSTGNKAGERDERRFGDARSLTSQNPKGQASDLGLNAAQIEYVQYLVRIGRVQDLEREWRETMYPLRVRWVIVVPIALGLAALVGYISYLAIRLTRAHRRLPSMGN